MRRGTRQNWHNGALLITGLLSMAGCHQYYTGGLGMADARSAQPSANHQYGPDDPAMAALPRPGNPGIADAGDSLGAALQTANATSGAPSASFAGMHLFGQLPGVRQGRHKVGADNVRRVTFATIGADFDPAMSPDGTCIAYASTSHSKTSDIFIKKIGSTAITQLTSDPANDVMPAFSPDGKRIAFCSDRSGNWNIYIMDAAGGQAVQVTDDRTDDLHPSFSPDGKELVYCSYGSATNQWELVVIDLNQPGVKHIIGRGLFPTWSPSGDAILFQRARRRGTRWFSVWCVRYANRQATSPTELAAYADAAAITPAWSTNGKHIVFCTVTDPSADTQSGGRADSRRDAADTGDTGGAGEVGGAAKVSDIWVMNADGSGRSRLTQGQFMNFEPVWGKGGTIYFVSNRAPRGVETIWSLNPAQAMALASRNAVPGPGVAASAAMSH